MVGYGKTFTALGIIASNPLDKIHVSKETVLTYSHNSMNVMGIRSNIENELDNNPANYLKTTLVIVPRGPVFLQWITMIEERTRLKALIIRDMKTIKDMAKAYDTYEKFKDYVEEFDLVLIKMTNMKEFNATMRVKNWARVMVDEAHDLFTRSFCSMVKALFYWFITGTPYLFQSNNSPLSVALRAMLKNEIIVQNKEEFVKSSFEIPAYQEIDYICKISAKFRAIRGFLPDSIVERINASDYVGAVREMGGTNANIDTMIDILTSNLKRELHNKKCERDMLERQDLVETDKQHKLQHINGLIHDYD
eukprot:768270-Hanusia_phi.AAC.3